MMSIVDKSCVSETVRKLMRHELRLSRAGRIHLLSELLSKSVTSMPALMHPDLQLHSFWAQHVHAVARLVPLQGHFSLHKQNFV